jgi:hypothetical protein
LAVLTVLTVLTVWVALVVRILIEDIDSDCG